MSTLLVVGGGEHARVVIEAARSQGGCWAEIVFCDAQECAVTRERLGVARIGGDAEGLALAGKGGVEVVIGVGNVGVSPVRARIAKSYADAGARFAVVIDARAIVSPTARVGAGALIMPGAIVNTGAVIGAHCVLNTGAIVEHDVVLGDFANVGPGAAIGGGSSVGVGSYLGLGSRVRDHVRIGSAVIVGMGSVVPADIEDGRTVMGVPARPVSGEPA